MERVTFGEVKLGNRVYQPDYFGPDKWREVTNFKVSGDGTVSLGLGVSARGDMDTRTYIVGHKDEVIGIR